MLLEVSNTRALANALLLCSILVAGILHPVNGSGREQYSYWGVGGGRSRHLADSRRDSRDRSARTSGDDSSALTTTTTTFTSKTASDSSNTNTEKTASKSSRTSTGTCSDNAMDITMSVDIAMEYPNDMLAVCSDQQEAEIETTIQTAVSDAFDTTVADWQGDVSFGAFTFDYDQEEMAKSAGEDEASCPDRGDVPCNAGFCRWGCLTVSATDCATSSLANWVNLEDDIQTALKDLGYDCLGSPDQLQIAVLVQDPDTVVEAPNSTLEENEDEEEEEEEEEEDTRDASKEKPENAEKEDVLGDLVAAGATVTRPDDSSTRSGSSTSGSKSDSGGDVSVAQKSGNSATSCEANAVEYPLNIDLQITYPNNEVVACKNQAEEMDIDAAISQALNDAFSTRVPDWEGGVEFGEISFGNRLRRHLTLRGSQSASLRRNLDTSACPDRSIDCAADYCRWGCLVASSTNCGTSSLANWANLADDVQAALGALDYECLGDALQINIMVDDPDGNGDVAVVDIEDTGTGARTFDQILAGFSEQTAEEETAADGPSRPLYIHSKFIFTFFPGTGREPTADEINLADVASKAYFKQQFQANDRFGSVFQDFQITQAVPKYDATNPDEFVLQCLVTVVVDEDAKVSSHQAAQVIGNSKFEDLIVDYLRVSEDSEFYNTFKVFFRGNTPKDR